MKAINCTLYIFFPSVQVLFHVTEVFNAFFRISPRKLCGFCSTESTLDSEISYETLTGVKQKKFEEMLFPFADIEVIADLWVQKRY